MYKRKDVSIRRNNAHSRPSPFTGCRIYGCGCGYSIVEHHQHPHAYRSVQTISRHHSTSQLLYLPNHANSKMQDLEIDRTVLRRNGHMGKKDRYFSNMAETVDVWSFSVNTMMFSTSESSASCSAWNNPGHLYLYIFMPLYHYTFIPLYLYTTIPLYLYTTIPLYHYTSIPIYLYLYTPIPLHMYTTMYTYTCIRTHICTIYTCKHNKVSV